MTKKIGIIFCLILCFLLCACGEKTKGENEMYVYYLNADKNTLIKEVYPTLSVEAALKKLEFHGVLTSKVKVERFRNMDGNLDLFFHADYSTMDKSTEVLTRAAVVQTMTQIKDVQFVTFYVDESLLTDGDGVEIGMMSAEDFVQDTGSSKSTTQTKDLILYFADADGQTLREKKVQGVRYKGNTSVERLVMEQLIKGIVEEGYQSTVPDTTILLGVSVKEGVCYVNLDSKFISDSYDLNPEVVVYSVVNSLIANGNALKVQILIDGASDVIYKNTVDLSRPLTGNESLIKIQ